MNRPDRVRANQKCFSKKPNPSPRIYECRSTGALDQRPEGEASGAAAGSFGSDGTRGKSRDRTMRASRAQRAIATLGSPRDFGPNEA